MNSVRLFQTHTAAPLPLPRRYREAFEAMGTSLEAQGIHLARVQPEAYRVWFPGGGGHLDLLNNEADMAAQLEAVEAGAADGFRCDAAHRGCPDALLSGLFAAFGTDWAGAAALCA